jgi:hypothetical protein
MPLAASAGIPKAAATAQHQISFSIIQLRVVAQYTAK